MEWDGTDIMFTSGEKFKQFWHLRDDNMRLIVINAKRQMRWRQIVINSPKPKGENLVGNQGILSQTNIPHDNKMS